MTNLSIAPPTQKVLNRQARYRLSLDFVEQLELTEIGLHGRRLALGLAHAVCRATSNWHNGSAVQPEAGYRLRCTDLRARLGLEGANGNRDLVKGLDELRAVRLLARAELTTGRQWLDWHLTDYTFDLLFEPVPYGLFDIRHARHLPTPLDHVIYNRIGVIRRCSTPQITLSVEGCAAVAERSSDWSRLRPAMFDTLVRVAGLFGVKLIAICECRGARVGIDHVTLEGHAFRDDLARGDTGQAADDRSKGVRRGREGLAGVEACRRVNRIRARRRIFSADLVSRHLTMNRSPPRKRRSSVCGGSGPLI